MKLAALIALLSAAAILPAQIGNNRAPVQKSFRPELSPYGLQSRLGGIPAHCIIPSPGAKSFSITTCPRAERKIRIMPPIPKYQPPPK